VFASSCSVYGASEKDQLLNEDSPLNPVSLYARTRIMSENVLLEGRGHMEPVILRLSTVFGFSRRMRYDLVVNTLTVRGVVDGKFQIHGGQQWRPFVHCRDVASAFAAAVTASSESVRPIVFNVGGERMNYTLAQIGEIVKAQIPEAAMEFSPNNDDPRNYRVSFARIKQHLRFEPKWTIEDGVKEMVSEIRSDNSLSRYREAVYSNLASLQARLVPANGAVPATNGTNGHAHGHGKPAGARSESATASRKP
jgi:nucleoside-diphosphate-sugar epimerase